MDVDREICTVAVSGVPRPGGSKRAFLNKRTGRIAIVDMGGAPTKRWRSLVAAAAVGVIDAPLTGPLAVDVVFILPRAKDHYRKSGLRETAPVLPTKRPDATKLWRSTEDALTGILWVDDAQIVTQTVSKIYEDLIRAPGAVITVREILQ
jgi:Holliday junction resolvase RusA-like endonuclease